MHPNHSMVSVHLHWNRKENNTMQCRGGGYDSINLLIIECVRIKNCICLNMECNVVYSVCIEHTRYTNKQILKTEENHNVCIYLYDFSGAIK